MAGAGLLFQAELQGEEKCWGVLFVLGCRVVNPLLLGALGWQLGWPRDCWGRSLERCLGRVLRDPRGQWGRPGKWLGHVLRDPCRWWRRSLAAKGGPKSWILRVADGGLWDPRVKWPVVDALSPQVLHHLFEPVDQLSASDVR